MTDVVKIAKEHLDALDTQIAKLEEFIRMAEALLKHNLSNSNKASDTVNKKPADGTGSAKTSPNSTAFDENIAEAEREGLSFRELKAGDRVHEPHTIHNEPETERHYPSFGRLHP